MYITVLDYNDGKVYQHKVESDVFEDYEIWLADKGHNISNIDWMLHEDSGIITN